MHRPSADGYFAGTESALGCSQYILILMQMLYSDGYANCRVSNIAVCTNYFAICPENYGNPQPHKYARLLSTAPWVDILHKLIYSSVLISDIYALALHFYPTHDYSAFGLQKV
jgi:hypothetical protein